jgi:hypothetical protein
MSPTVPFEIASLHALEILDSRGRPTLAVTVTLSDGTPPEPACLQAHRPDRRKPSNYVTEMPPATTEPEC